MLKSKSINKLLIVVICSWNQQWKRTECSCIPWPHRVFIYSTCTSHINHIAQTAIIYITTRKLIPAPKDSRTQPHAISRLRN